MTRTIGTDDFRKLMEYHHGNNDVKLDDRLKRMYERYKYCYGNIDKYGLDWDKITKMQMHQFRDISFQTARNDYYTTVDLFHADRAQHKIDFMITLSIAHGWRQFDKCVQDGDNKAAAAMYKTITNLLANLAKMPKAPERPPATLIVVGSDPTVIGVEPLSKKELEKRLKYWTYEKKTKIKNRYELAEEAEVIPEDDDN